jgi:hypothetical protein
VRASIVVVVVVASCGGGGTTPAVDAPACEPSLIYLDRGGGDYTHGPVDDATTNQSVIVDVPRTLPPFPNGDVAWADLTACVRAGLAPFAVTLTETDPGDVPHLEIVFTTSYWGGSALATAIPSSCRPGHQIEFVFGDAVSSPTRGCHVALDGLAEMAAQLSPALDCIDFTSPAADCGVRRFVDYEQACVDPAGLPTTCRCGGATTENTYQALAARFAPCH